MGVLWVSVIFLHGTKDIQSYSLSKSKLPEDYKFWDQFTAGQAIYSRKRNMEGIVLGFSPNRFCDVAHLDVRFADRKLLSMPLNQISPVDDPAPKKPETVGYDMPPTDIRRRLGAKPSNDSPVMRDILH